MLPLRQRLERLVQRIHDNLPDRHVPRPRLVHPELFQQVDECLFSLDCVVESRRRYHGFRAQIGERVVDGFEVGQCGGWRTFSRRRSVWVMSGQCLRVILGSILDPFDIPVMITQTLASCNIIGVRQKHTLRVVLQLLYVSWFPLPPLRLSALIL